MSRSRKSFTASDNRRIINVDFEYPPIPSRSHDWAATTDNYEPGDPIGWGRSASDAVSDLLIEIGCINEEGEVTPAAECTFCLAVTGETCRVKIVNHNEKASTI